MVERYVQKLNRYKPMEEGVFVIRVAREMTRWGRHESTDLRFPKDVVIQSEPYVEVQNGP